jgi:hypothetical protein
VSARIRSSRALALLLSLALGGIATPLAHQVDHLIDLWSGAPATDLIATTPDSGSTTHDCELCEVRLASTGPDTSERAQLEALPEIEAATPTTVAHQPLRSFDGRAPPTQA